ncbi:MAG: hypothetical protein SAMD01599839_09960 [Rectinema sp.]
MSKGKLPEWLQKSLISLISCEFSVRIVSILDVPRSGHARVLTEAVAARLDAKPIEIVDLVSRKGVLGFLKSGAQAVRAGSPGREPEETA